MDAGVELMVDRVWPRVAGLALLAASPLVFYLPAQSAFILPKFPYIVCVVFILLLCTRLSFRSSRSVVASPKTVTLALLLWLLYSVASFPWFDTTHADIREPFSLGVLLLTLSLFTFWPLRGREAAILCSVMLAFGVVESLYGVVQYLGIDLPIYKASDTILLQAQFAQRGGTPSATFGNPNFFAEYLAGLLVLGSAVYLGADRKGGMPCLSIGLVSIFSALMLTGTRAAWMGSLAGGLLILTWGGKALWRRPQARLLTAVFLLLALPALIPIKALSGSGIALTRLEKMFALREGSVGARLLWWRVTLGIIADHPLFGVGTGRFREQYPAYQRAFFTAHPSARLLSGRFTEEEAPLESPHNQYLHLLAEQGILGFGLFAWVVLSLLNVGRRKLSSCAAHYRPTLMGAVAALIALLVIGLFAYPFQLPTSALLFGTLAGVILADPEGCQDATSNEGAALSRADCAPPKGPSLAPSIGLTLLTLLYLAFLTRIYVSSLSLHRGIERFLRKEYQEAAAIFQRALDTNPRDPEIHLALGRALLLSGGVADAIPHFTVAQIGFDSPRLRQDLAGCYVSVGLLDQAEQAYLDGIATYPGHAGLQASYGAFLARMGRYDDALTSLLHAHNLDPHYPDTYHYLGHLRHARHEPDRAITALQDFLRYASPADPRRFVDSALLHTLQPRHEVTDGLEAP